MEVVIPRLMPLWTTPDNPCSCIVIPASHESPIVMHAVMALSAYHHSLETSSNVDQDRCSDSAKALWHKQRVLLLLQETLNKPEVLRDDATLAACMLLQTFEVSTSEETSEETKTISNLTKRVLLSGTSGWDHWLKGAMLFIQMRERLEYDLYDNAETALKLVWSRRRDALTWEERVSVDWDDLSKEMNWRWCFV